MSKTCALIIVFCGVLNIVNCSSRHFSFTERNADLVPAMEQASLLAFTTLEKNLNSSTSCSSFSVQNEFQGMQLRFLDRDFSLSISTKPSIKFNEIRPNLKSNYIDIDVELSNLIFVATSKDSSQHNISLSFGWKSIKITGSAGILVDNNTYKSSFYDLKYDRQNLFLNTSENANNPVNNFFLKKAVKHLNVFHLLEKYLQLEIDSILKSIQLSEIFEETTLERYKNYSRALRFDSNQFIDDVLKMLSNIITISGYSEVPVDDFYEEFTHVFRGYVLGRNGTARNMATITRISEFFVRINEPYIEVIGGLGLKELSTKYNYFEAKLLNAGPSGSLFAFVKSNKAFIRFNIIQDHNGVFFGYRLVDYDFEIMELDNIVVHLNGSGDFFDWLNSIMATIVVSYMQDNLKNVLEQHIKGLLDGFVG